LQIYIKYAYNDNRYVLNLNKQCKEKAMLAWLRATSLGLITIAGTVATLNSQEIEHDKQAFPQFKSALAQEDAQRTQRAELQKNLEEQLLESGYDAQEFLPIQTVWNEYKTMLADPLLHNKSLPQFVAKTDALLDRLKYLMDQYSAIKDSSIREPGETISSHEREILEKEEKYNANQQDLLKKILRDQLESLQQGNALVDAPIDTVFDDSRYLLREAARKQDLAALQKAVDSYAQAGAEAPQEIKDEFERYQENIKSSRMRLLPGSVQELENVIELVKDLVAAILEDDNDKTDRLFNAFKRTWQDIRNNKLLPHEIVKFSPNIAERIEDLLAYRPSGKGYAQYLAPVSRWNIKYDILGPLTALVQDLEQYRNAMPVVSGEIEKPIQFTTQDKYESTVRDLLDAATRILAGEEHQLMGSDIYNVLANVLEQPGAEKLSQDDRQHAEDLLTELSKTYGLTSPAPLSDQARIFLHKRSQEIGDFASGLKEYGASAAQSALDFLRNLKSSGSELAQKAGAALTALWTAREAPVRLLQPVVRAPHRLQKEAQDLAYEQLLNELNKLIKQAQSLARLRATGLILDEAATKAAPLYWKIAINVQEYIVKYYENYGSFDSSMYRQAQQALGQLAGIFTREQSPERELLSAPLIVFESARKRAYSSDNFKNIWNNFKATVKLPISPNKIELVDHVLSRVDTAIIDALSPSAPAEVMLDLWKELTYLRAALADLFTDIPVLAIALTPDDLEHRLQNWITIATKLLEAETQKSSAHLPDIIADNLKTYAYLYGIIKGDEDPLVQQAYMTHYLIGMRFGESENVFDKLLNYLQKDPASFTREQLADFQATLNKSGYSADILEEFQEHLQKIKRAQRR
jgi:hypothetical protein